VRGIVVKNCARGLLPIGDIAAVVRATRRTRRDGISMLPWTRLHTALQA
jgi:hypothetical protein